MANRYLTRWDPFENLLGWDSNVDRLVGEWMRPALTQRGNAPAFNPSCDVTETPTHYQVHFDIPGVSRDDIHVEFKDNLLTISGERRSESRDDSKRHVIERFYGRFQRSFQLPENVDSARIEANYKDGVLDLSIPKIESPKPKKIEIKG